MKQQGIDKIVKELQLEDLKRELDSKKYNLNRDYLGNEGEEGLKLSNVPVSKFLGELLLKFNPKRLSHKYSRGSNRFELYNNNYNFGIGYGENSYLKVRLNKSKFDVDIHGTNFEYLEVKIKDKIRFRGILGKLGLYKTNFCIYANILYRMAGDGSSCIVQEEHGIRDYYIDYANKNLKEFIINLISQKE